MRARFEHRVIDGKPVGLRTTVEHQRYLGFIDGKPAYELSAVEKWRALCITTWVGIAAFVLYHFLGH